MLKSRIRRREIEAAHAVATLAEIEASVTALGDEDLLDLADIFARETPSPLKAMSATEMTRRNLAL